jgi:hypothetical protein
MSEKSRLTLLACLETLELQIDPALAHRNPDRPGYSSSSYSAELGGFMTPRGGYGPPQDVNASFCHDHTEPSFKKLHPNVDTSTYRTLPSPRRRKNRAKAADIPSIVVTDTDAAEHEKCKELSPAKARGVSSEPKVEVHETSSAAAVEAIVEEKKEINVAAQTIPVEDEVAVEHAVAAVAAHIPEKAENNDDSGIVLEDSVVSDNENSNNQDTSQDSTKSVDSTYGTQPVVGTNITSEAATNTLSDADILSGSDVFDHGDTDTARIASPNQLRKKLIPKVPFAARRSSRLSALTTDSQPASDSSLGKRGHEDDADTNVPSPKGKRTKATRP